MPLATAAYRNLKSKDWRLNLFVALTRAIKYIKYYKILVLAFESRCVNNVSYSYSFRRSNLLYG